MLNLHIQQVSDLGSDIYSAESSQMRISLELGTCFSVFFFIDFFFWDMIGLSGL